MDPNGLPRPSDQPLAIITPSRARPDNIGRMLTALESTVVGPWTLWLGVDDDDAELKEYLYRFDLHQRVVLYVGERQTLSAWTNRLAELAIADGAKWLASLGDDHVPRTHGWDRRLIEAASAFDGPGFAYGDDQLQGANVPTAWVQSAQIVAALGWMMLPQCEHLYVDSAILDLGRKTRRISYVGGVVIEHMHPAAQKATEDDTYRSGNSDARIAADGAEYRAWLANGLERDASKMRELRWP